MSDFVADTVALILRLEGRRMGQQVRQVFGDVKRGSAQLHIPAMVFAEILYLAERKRIAIGLNDIHAYIQRFPRCRQAPLTFEIVTTAQQITDIPELHDRLIAATALWLSLPLLTVDATIIASTYIQTVW